MLIFFHTHFRMSHRIGTFICTSKNNVINSLFHKFTQLSGLQFGGKKGANYSFNMGFKFALLELITYMILGRSLRDALKFCKTPYGKNSDEYAQYGDQNRDAGENRCG